MADKTTLLVAEENVLVDGLIGSQQVPRIKYSSQDLHTFLLRLNDLMPVIREALLEKSYRKWQQREIDRIERIRYESFMAGMAVQKSLLLDFK